MPKSYSGDLRERVIEAVEGGASRRETAKSRAPIWIPLLSWMLTVMPQSRLQTLALLALVTFSGVGHCEDAGEATRTSATFGVRVSSRGYEQTCSTIQRAAADNGLPVDFFAKLIWQESRFDPGAHSPAGAQGIAQFMPRTAFLRGLTNAFDPVEALRESASYLRELKTTFGNLGLAAAAYNAGPGRLSRWLSGKNSLPQETVEYVQIVTGKPIEEWSSDLSSKWDGVALPKEVPCSTLARLSTEPSSHDMPVPPPTWAPWGVQLLGNWTQGEVLASYEKLRRRHLAVLRDKDPLIVVTYGPSGMSKRFLVRVAENTRQEAEQVCSKFQQEGASCFAVRNPNEQETAVRSERYAARLTVYAQTYSIASTRSHASWRASR
jgi:Transglycosylase SLT domain